jgi:hypothetical protein
MVEESNQTSRATKTTMYNEQYSRKYNVRIINYPQKMDEKLH